MGEAKTGRIFSGVQPTGNLHLGNYLGAIKNWIALQDEFECIYCVVDLHAITVPQEPVILRRAIREVAACLIASGINPEKSILFNQSRVPQHAELAWIFNCVARLGWLNRMTQFKEKAGKNRENATVGLYAYPTLMAADILAYRATHVPVGEDQKQHLELTRDIATQRQTPNHCHLRQKVWKDGRKPPIWSVFLPGFPGEQPRIYYLNMVVRGLASLNLFWPSCALAKSHR